MFLLSPALAGGVAVKTVGGTLLVDGGAALGGSGGVLGDLHVLKNGTVDMGFGSTGAGNLMVLGNAVFDADSTYIVDINPLYGAGKGLRSSGGGRQLDAAEYDAEA